MTRKDYPFLAAVLRRVRAAYAPHWDPNLFRACNDHAVALADALGHDNPRFDRMRFLDDCGVPKDRFRPLQEAAESIEAQASRYTQGLPQLERTKAAHRRPIGGSEQPYLSSGMRNCSHGVPNSADCRECKAAGLI